MKSDASGVQDIREIPIGGKRVLVRAALNVPIVGGVVADDLRIERSLQTIQWLTDGGAKVGIVGHLGRSGATLLPVFETLREHVPRLEWIAETPDMLQGDPIGALPDGSVAMFENVRRVPGETENDPGFADALSRLADIYVNDAFADSHRAHASIVGVPARLPSYAGIAFLAEMKELSRAHTPAHPALAIMGGAKFETKEPLIRRFLDLYEHVLVGGALANDFFVQQGFEVGTSMVSDRSEADIKRLMAHPHLLLPPDVIADGPAGRRASALDALSKEESIRDAGPGTVAMMEEHIAKASFILWNGPLGAYEDGFVQGTESLAKAIAKSQATTIVGGGDTVAAIRALDIADRFSFLSTAGGAMIDFLADGTIPGIEALAAAAMRAPSAAA